MYLNALLNGLKIFPKIPLNVRKKGKQMMNKLGSKKFYEKLRNENSECVYNIFPNDKIRLLRSWEIYEVSKKSIYEINKKKKIQKLNSIDFLKILIVPPKKQVYLNCANRWKKMIKLGAIKEVKTLIKKEKKLKKRNLIKTIGFKELRNFIEKKSNIKDSEKSALQATRNYAKRQYTWFRHQFSANIEFEKKYEKKNKEFFLKEIQDKLLTN